MPRFRDKSTGTIRDVEGPRVALYDEHERWERLAVTDRPPKAATREDWDSYALKLDLDPHAFSSKDELIAAIDKKEGK